MAIKQYVSLNEPLCGIGTYKDTLNLDTGATVRQIRKLVLTGDEESWGYNSQSEFFYLSTVTPDYLKLKDTITSFCSHYKSVAQTINAAALTNGEQSFWYAETVQRLYIKDTNYTSITSFKQYLADQYAAGTPVTVWYVLATPTTSTTALPHGLSGIVEGSLTQSDTPTPTNPIYPTANSINSFLDKKYLKYGTETDTLTTLPKTIIGDGQSASAVIKGNMSQSSQPTPTSPIYPSECGDKTANLFSSTWESGNINSTTGQNEPSGTVCHTKDYIPVTPNTIYSMKRSIYTSYINVRFYRADKTYIGGGSSSTINIIVGSRATNPMLDGIEFCVFELIDTDIAYMRINDASNNVNTRYMMVEGQYTSSTMPTYEPFGYKIPISSANTTTPVYLGEVQSTRQIEKLVLTGEEMWTKGVFGGHNGFLTYAPNTQMGVTNCICSHYKVEYANKNYTLYFIAQPANGRFIIFDDRFSSSDDFKTYLAQQYAAGTPVTVWYVLSTATTGTLNEPIRKIGDYADEVSGITIPTIAGADSFDVLTTLKPSEVQLTYHGWHEHSDTVFTE